MNYFTDDEADAINASDLNRDTPFAIRGVTQTMFSIARHYGGTTFNGERYTYFSEFDELIRDDVLKWLKKYRAAKKPTKKRKVK